MWKKFAVQITTTSDLLATQAQDLETRLEYLDARPDESVEHPDESLKEKKIPVSVFHTGPSGEICLLNYQIKGWIKQAVAACPTFLGIKARTGADIVGESTVKKYIDLHLDVKPRFISTGKKEHNGTLVRPLRARTMQGERVALVGSHTLTAPITLKFTVITLEKSVLTLEMLTEIFKYGEHGVGLLSWRNAGYGQFILDSIKEIKG